MLKTSHSIKTLLQQPPQLRLISVMATNGNSTPLLAEYKQLGKSGLRVSVPIFGAMSFGDKRWAPWVIEENEVQHPRYSDGP